MKIYKLVFAGIFTLLVGANAALAGGDAAAGEAKAASCNSCHGADGMGDADNPKLAGMDEAYFVEQLVAYKSGEREHALMQMLSSPLSEEDMADLAAYYATLGE